MNNVPTQTDGVSGVLASDWNAYVRDNFDNIKYGHVVVANDAAKTALGSVAEGTMVYQSDNNKIFVYSGSAWVEINDLDNVGGTVANGAQARVVRTTTTTGTSQNVPISWEAAVYDPLGMWSVGTPTVLTIPFTGVWAVTFQGYLDFLSGTPTNLAAPVIFRITYSNPSTVQDHASFVGQTSGTPNYAVYQTMSTIMFLNAGCTIDVKWDRFTGAYPASQVWVGAASDATRRTSLSVAYVGQ